MRPGFPNQHVCDLRETTSTVAEKWVGYFNSTKHLYNYVENESNRLGFGLPSSPCALLTKQKRERRNGEGERGRRGEERRGEEDELSREEREERDESREERE